MRRNPFLQPFLMQEEKPIRSAGGKPPASADRAAMHASLMKAMAAGPADDDTSEGGDDPDPDDFGLGDLREKEKKAKSEQDETQHDDEIPDDILKGLGNLGLEGEEEEEEEPEVTPSDKDKGKTKLKEVTGNDPQVSEKAGKRFKEYKAALAENRTAYDALTAEHETSKAALAKLQADFDALKNGGGGNVLESAEYKKLKTDFDALNSDHERVSLLSSPTFKKTFDQPIADSYRKLTPYAKKLDADSQQAFVNDLGALLRFEGGEEHDPDFQDEVDSILEKYEFRPSTSSAIRTSLMSVRDLVNKRQERINDWKGTAETFEADRGKQVEGVVTEAVSSLKKFWSGWEDENRALVDQMRNTTFKDAEGKDQNLFRYDEIVGGGVQFAHSAIADSIRKGGPTPALLQLAHEAVIGRMNAHRLQLAIPSVQLLQKELKEANRRLAEAGLSEAAPRTRTKKGGKPASGGDGEESLADLLAKVQEGDE